MKKVIKIALYSLLAIIILALVILHISYHSFSPGDKGAPVNENNLVYFQESYDDCRQAFRSEAAKASSNYEKAKTFAIRVPSKIDQDLYIDFLYLPSLKDTSKLLVISSGVHGVEGFTGSAVQQMFLKELLDNDILSEMSVLMIHGMNPYGLKYGRRFTENNVDLNRGSDIDSSLFQTQNEGYLVLKDMLNPQGKVSEGSLRNQFFYLITMSKTLKESMSVLRQAIVQGQYEIPEGIFFGGTDFEPQIDSTQKIISEIFSPYESILAIDLHTGYGSRRVLNLFPNAIDDPELKAKTETIFTGHQIEWGNTEDFYEISGGFVSTFLQKLNPAAEYLYMVFEWGTYDSQKTFGSIKSLQKMINENQGYHYGYKNARQEQKIKQHNLELYYPDSEAWRSEVLRSGREMFELALKMYPEI